MKSLDQLWPGHVIHTLVEEHKIILDYLDKLKEACECLNKKSQFADAADCIEKIKNVADHLIGAEPHHQREEQVLFPEMESQGVVGPPTVMRHEHESMREAKHRLKKLTEEINTDNFEESRNQIQTTGAFLVSMLGDHIYKENNILYPMALEVIQDEAMWETMKQSCDSIGYCCFTPQS